MEKFIFPVWAYVIFVSCLVCIPKCTCVANWGSEHVKQLQTTLSPGSSRKAYRCPRQRDARVGLLLVAGIWKRDDILGRCNVSYNSRNWEWSYSTPTEMGLWDHTSPYVRVGSLFKAGWLDKGGTFSNLGIWPHTILSPAGFSHLCLSKNACV